jgi:hypothetical protein
MDMSENFHRKTDEIFVSVETPLSEQNQPESQETIRFIDVHIYDFPTGQEEPPSVESERAQEPTTDETNEQEDTEPGQPPHRNRRRAALVCICVLCVLLLVGGSVLYLFPLVSMSATVTIVPVTRQITTTNTLTVLTGHAATGTQQIPGNELSSVTMSQEQTVPTTGKGHQDATQAHGTVTFYNAAPSQQIMTAGTLLTGGDGVQIVTDQDAIIPAAQYPTFGQATVIASSVLAGPGGNVRAADIYGPCCHLNISATNSAFSGGQLARDYQMVTQQDIDNVASSLKTSLDKSVQAALKTQVADDQTLLTPVSCQQSTTPDHRPGTEATQVQVTVSETCTGVTYNTQAYQTLVAHFVTQAATQQLGEGYTQTGTIQSSIVQVNAKAHGVITLQVKSSASYSYQFTQEQQQALKSLIAGKTKAQATTALLQTPGVQSVSLSLSHGNQLPTDTGRIHITFLLMM